LCGKNGVERSALKSEKAKSHDRNSDRKYRQQHKIETKTKIKTKIAPDKPS
jgi:hypothetical protein